MQKFKKYIMFPADREPHSLSTDGVFTFLFYFY